jgi:hypothetical protein
MATITAEPIRNSGSKSLSVKELDMVMKMGSGVVRGDPMR